MASSVSSERAFSSAGITISKRRNRLKADIIEALQFLKVSFRNSLIFRDVLGEDLLPDTSDGAEGWDSIIDNEGEDECTLGIENSDEIDMYLLK